MKWRGNIVLMFEEGLGVSAVLTWVSINVKSTGFRTSAFFENIDYEQAHTA